MKGASEGVRETQASVVVEDGLKCEFLNPTTHVHLARCWIFVVRQPVPELAEKSRNGIGRGWRLAVQGKGEESGRNVWCHAMPYHARPC
jgi:hypothetical protein